MRKKTALLGIGTVTLISALLMSGARTETPTYKWSSTGALHTVRKGACAALLPDGSVLITGGKNNGAALATAERFTGYESVDASPMSHARADHACVALNDGRILVAGGVTSGDAATNAVEVFDPETRSWSLAGSMTSARSGATASLLADGRVLVAGGSVNGVASDTLEIFDPQANAFAPVFDVLTARRSEHAAAVLRDGRVLIAGGWDGEKALETVDVFDAGTGRVALLGKMSSPRTGLSATTLLEGRVYFAGGSDGKTDLATTDLFSPVDGSFTAAAPMSVARRGHLALRIEDNNSILLVGGTFNGEATASTELYIPWWNSYRELPSAAPAGDGTVTALKSRGAVMMTSSSSTTVNQAAVATVTTNKNDYSPGETVTVSGTGWQPGETVQIVITEDPPNHPTHNYTVTADANGAFSQTIFTVDVSHIGVRFYLTATGVLSGRTAQTTFTDGNIAVNATATVTLDWRKFNGNSSCSGDGNGNGSQTIGPSTTFEIGVNNGQSLRLTVPVTPGNQTFTAWTGASSATTAAVCIAGAAGPLPNTTANYSVLDTTPPVITPNITGTLGTNGWYITNVTVNWILSEPESTISSSNGCGPTTVNSDTAGTTFTCTATSAGGTATQSVIIKRDATAPTLAFGAQSPAANGNGWNNTDVSFPFTAADAMSGVASSSPATSPLVLTAQGASVTGTVTVTDNAGNSATFTSPAVKIDKTAPTIAFVSRTAPNGNGWNNTDVTVNWSCADNSGSGATAISVSQTVSSEGQNQSSTGTCSDLAGNTAQNTQTGINIDKTKPTVTPQASPAANVNGWNNTNVTVTFSGNDALSGIDFCSAAVTLSSEGANQSAGPGTCTDKAGHVSYPTTASNINIDKTAPSLVGSRLPAPNGFGWNNTDVTVSFACSDSLSGLDAGPVTPQVVSTEGAGQSRSAACTDKAGNSSAATVSGINIDKTKPVVSNVLMNPNPVAVNTNTSITANGDTGGTSLAPIVSASFTVDGGIPVPMNATDGTFNGTNENVTKITTFPATDVANLCVTVKDAADNVSEPASSCLLAVFYDPNGGFVTGGGWINSPAGAYIANPSLAGKASFGFNSKYQKGATIPTGNTEFLFHAGSFNFKSTDYQWLVVAGAKAQFKGTGTVNGSGNYGFLLTAVDGQVNGGGGLDKFRIKVWDKNNGDAVVYDNLLGASDEFDQANSQTLGGGSVVIHDGGKK